MYDPYVQGLVWGFDGDIETDSKGRPVQMDGFDHWARQFLLELNLSPNTWLRHPEMGLNVVSYRGQFNTEENRLRIKKELERQIVNRGLAAPYTIKVEVTSVDTEKIQIHFILIGPGDRTRLGYILNASDGSVQIDNTQGSIPEEDPTASTDESLIENKYLRRRVTQ